MHNQSDWTFIKVFVALQNLPDLLWYWSRNQTEKKKSSASTILKKLERPDMLICAESATVYVGEDKVSVS